ncbi:hypothetical protein [Actinomyces trachealis]|uniref:hypothetical protein n=1 Tax=Actinomyces trachealis TaxID=2763540 RepID=UPI0018C6EBD6|nr:hypothetical protein [Actinomyces trachealis]
MQYTFTRRVGTHQATTAELQVLPQEVFTGQQAVEVFADYVLHATLPPKHLLRPLDL